MHRARQFLAIFLNQTLFSYRYSRPGLFCVQHQWLSYSNDPVSLLWLSPREESCLCLPLGAERWRLEWMPWWEALTRRCRAQSLRSVLTMLRGVLGVPRGHRNEQVSVFGEADTGGGRGPQPPLSGVAEITVRRNPGEVRGGGQRGLSPLSVLLQISYVGPLREMVRNKKIQGQKLRSIECPGIKDHPVVDTGSGRLANLNEGETKSGKHFSVCPTELKMRENPKKGSGLRTASVRMGPGP